MDNALAQAHALLFAQQVVVADKQHTVAGGNAEERDEPDDGRDAQLARGAKQHKHASYQCQRQVEQDNGTLHPVLELDIEQQEYHHNAHQRSKQQGAAGGLLAFELPPILDMIPFGQADFIVYPLADIVYHTAQVAPAGIGGDDNFTFHVLPVDGVGSY